MPCEQCHSPLQVMHRILDLAEGKKVWSQVWHCGTCATGGAHVMLQETQELTR